MLESYIPFRDIAREIKNYLKEGKKDLARNMLGYTLYEAALCGKMVPACLTRLKNKLDQ